MTRLFSEADLGHYLHNKIKSVTDKIERLDEEEILSRSIDDLVHEYVEVATVEPLVIHAHEPIDGDVVPTSVDVSRDYRWHGNTTHGYRVRAVYSFEGDPNLFRYTPSRRTVTDMDATIGDGTVAVEIIRPGTIKPDDARAALKEEIDVIRRMAQYASTDVEAHNRTLRDRIQNIVEGRKKRVMQRRDLAGALRFKLTKRADAPKPVPLSRKPIGIRRRIHAGQQRKYEDEPALTTAQYEDAIDVVTSTLLAMERTPSTVSRKSEEELRDQILVQLNGTFEGAATGETFVQKGKTDILIRVEDRHVFVAECKWWSGPKACTDAVNQLLSYLPWRDEKAALIFFIDRRDATAVIAKANDVVRSHPAFKRVGPPSKDTSSRQNYILGHPDDRDREIHLVGLFAVVAKG